MSDPDKPTLARHDLWTGLALALLGLATAEESWRMPRLEERGIDPWTAPGIVPGVLGAALAVLGVVLALRAAKEVRAAPAARPVRIFGEGDARRRFLVALALNLVYACLLVGRIPYAAATAVYVFAFMAVFGLEPRRPGVLARLAVFGLVTAAATAGVIYLFETLFLVRLP
ncbi:tripartite tricarboxylate transporter TctB family protein [Prosthecomicrobium sp. N25]|uniref:tripartite tricarboxylate transporter TctB family protein n=1 Tax=Prosthecomicrobium sp. N25 TaxID=3129254 RepID=UPI0030782E23